MGLGLMSVGVGLSPSFVDIGRSLCSFGTGLRLGLGERGRRRVALAVVFQADNGEILEHHAAPSSQTEGRLSCSREEEVSTLDRYQSL